MSVSTVHTSDIKLCLGHVNPWAKKGYTLIELSASIYIYAQSKMQEWFNEGKRCDLTIEIAIPDDGDTGAAGKSGRGKKRKAASNNDRKVEIKCHSLVLGARSNHIRLVAQK